MTSLFLVDYTRTNEIIRRKNAVNDISLQYFNQNFKITWLYNYLEINDALVRLHVGQLDGSCLCNELTQLLSCFQLAITHCREYEGVDEGLTRVGLHLLTRQEEVRVVSVVLNDVPRNLVEHREESGEDT